MKLRAVPTLLCCALVSSIVVASEDLHKHRPRARYSCSETPDFPAITGSHSQPVGHKNVGSGAYDDLEDDADSREYTAVNDLDPTEDVYPGDGGEYAHGYPSGNNDEAPFEDDPDFEVPDEYHSEADQHGSSHSGHYSQGAPLGQDKVSDDDVSMGGDSSSDALVSEEDGISYDAHDIYGQDTSSPAGITSSLSASNLPSNLPDGSTQSTTADTPTGPSETTIAISIPVTPSNTIIDLSTTSTGPLPSATQRLCPDKNMQCVDGFLIGCAAVPNFIDDEIGASKFVGGVTNPQICHQLCIEDPLCTSWIDSDEPQNDFFFGGCWHYNQPMVLNSTEPFVGSIGINSGGIRGACDLGIPGSILTMGVTTPVTTSSTALLTSSQSVTAIVTSPSTSGDIVTIPTSETSLCPQLDGQCLNSNVIRCDRDLDLDADPEYSNYVCLTPLPIITSERECHETCLTSFECIGWKMTQVLTNVSASECCHVWGSLEPRDPLPQQPALATYPEYNSYGLRFRCDDGRQGEELCPKAENTCLDDFLIKCDRFLFDDLTPATADYTYDWQSNIFSQLGCHQACAEDSTCTAWGGYSEPLDSGEGGGEQFDCYHVHTPVVLQSPLPDFVREPDPGSAARYGVRGACA